MFFGGKYMFVAFKSAACGLAVMCAATAAQSAGAIEVFVQGASIPSTYGTLYSDTGGTVVQEGAALISIAVNVGTGPTAAPLFGSAFCVDLFHPIYVGLDNYYATNVQYHVTPLTTDSSGNPLTASQIDQIGGLATLGFGLVGSNAFELGSKLAAIQAAIWTIEYPSTVFSPDNANPLPNLTQYTADYLALAPTLHGTPYVINTDTPGAAQNLIISFSSTQLGIVPEPASWALLITGFGMTGVAARRRKAGVVTA